MEYHHFYKLHVYVIGIPDSLNPYGKLGVHREKIMKKLLITVSFVITPFISGVSLAGGCEHGHYAQQHADNEEALIAQDADTDLLELLKKQREKEALESETITYN